MKILIDTKGQRIPFAEAGKDFVDFLFTLLSLPIGSVVGLLLSNSTGMVGSLGRVCFTGLGRPGQDCIPVRCLVATFREWDNLTCTVKESHFRRIKLTRFPPGSVLSQTHRPILLSLAGVSCWYLSPKQVHQIVSTIEAALPR
ncbi:hypothetical protein FEM48_Zijuj03G0074600 [Ziziphus jujuba var. spinosa]|uniref:Uncharacterized protein n=1 Tax=Ziziphus jujuba var. spinosa TaxID=714518 RepID=A0A978VNZ1_ZIZJJ|nr:hypothetical protein FEM48_Zijuj03G0074600 [Ziziphus jujuba var. spinosa]